MNYQIFFQILFLLPFTLQQCAQGQETMYYDEIEPCPFLSKQQVCCDTSEIDKMSSNFQSIDATFGADGGGCDICGANLKRFWCIYTCAPDQGVYLKYVGKANMTDPRNETNLVEVDLINLTVHPDVACGVFSSCQRTKFAAQVTAMQTPGGFFSFQGEQAISQGQQYIKFIYQTQDSLQVPYIPSCDSKFTNSFQEDGKTMYLDESGYIIKEECGCNTCDSSCDSSQILYTSSGVFEGFEGTYVLIAWGWCLVSAVGVTLYRKCTYEKEEEKNNNKQDIEEQLNLK